MTNWGTLAEWFPMNYQYCALQNAFGPVSLLWTYFLSILFFKYNKPRQLQHTIFTKHITRLVRGKTQTVYKHKTRSGPEYGGVVINLCKAIFTSIAKDEGGHVFTPFCLFVYRISQKVVDGSQWNFVDRLGMWQGRSDSILVKIRIWILIRELFNF